MKKILLSLILFTIGISAYAADPVVSISTEAANQRESISSYTASWKLGVPDSEQTWTIANFNNNKNATSWNNIRCGRKSGNASIATITTDFAISEAINAVEINMIPYIKTADKDKLKSLTLEIADNSDFENAVRISASDYMTEAQNTVEDVIITIPNPAPSRYYRLVFDCLAASNNGFCAVNSIKYYGTEVAGTVATPIISIADNNMVTISHADGGSIYYTTDDSEPSTSSTRYTAPFAISATTTVKAIAVLNGKSSAVASKTLKLNTVNNIAEFIALANSNDTKINCAITAVYQNGKNLYIKDANNNFILSFGTIDGLTDVKNGDQFSFISGKYSPYRGLPELVPSAIGEKSQGTEVDPYEMNIEDLTDDMLNQYVVFENMTITANGTSGRSYKMTDGTNTLDLYNNFYEGNTNGYTAVEIPEGEGFTVYGFVSTNNGTLQLQPIKVEGGTVMETVETPVFTPASGSELKEGAEITIACATAGATIYYTTDGSDPANGGNEYTQPIKFTGDAMTVKAIATKADMLDSDVATATYTLFVEGSTKATFNFGEDGNITTLTTSEIEANNVQTPDGKNNLSGVMFNNSPLTLLLLKNSSNTTPRWWGTATIKPELRVYTNNEITVAVSENGYKLSSVEFTRGTAAATNFNALDVTATTNLGEGQEGTWDKETKTWTAPNGIVNKVVFTVSANARMCGITAVYVADPNATAAGIEGIAAENNADAPVEYYNLQGVRVNGENLSNGIYIRRQGSDVSKVYIVR
jgi:carbohydrate binding family 6